MQVNIKYLHPDAKTPSYGTAGAACFDLYAATASCSEWGADDAVNDNFTTGLAFEIPEGYCMKIYPRSGISFKHNATLCNSVPVIDCDFRGDVVVKYNKPIPYGAGDRIAQAEIVPMFKADFQVIEDLNETKRGQNGFGSTGIN